MLEEPAATAPPLPAAAFELNIIEFPELNNILEPVALTAPPSHAPTHVCMPLFELNSILLFVVKVMVE
jgi:hypothetical protein